MQQGQIVLVDTNIIIEAVRTNCWHALLSYFTVETVQTCIEEARTGDPLRREYVAVSDKELEGVHQTHAVTQSMRAGLALALPDAAALDPGERDLFAHALTRDDAWIAGCADRAALKAAFSLGWKDRFVSLEALCRAAGIKPHLKAHFQELWLSKVRTAFLLDQGL